jgi:hypothetical protein
MAAPSEMKLIATRVPREVWDILQVVAVVEDAATMQDLLRPVVEAYAEKMGQEPEVQAILGEASKYRARKSPISHITQARKPAKKRG